jgi:hypothetical protein
MRTTASRVKVLGTAAVLAAAMIVAGGDATVAVQPVIWTLNMPSPQANASFSIASMGDLNGDARADIVVGAGGATVGMNANQGRAYAFNGMTGALMWTFNTENPQAGGFFGYRVFANADVDGDAKADAIVSAPYETVGANAGQGRVYIFSGATGAYVRTLTTPNAQVDAHFGFSIAAGDMDGDSKDEVIVGAGDEDVATNVDQGRAYVFSGATGALMQTLNSPNPEDGGRFGTDIAAGLIDSGAQADIVVGAPGEAVATLEEQGRAYAFAGGTWALLHSFVSPNPQEFSGCCTVATGDVNGDGRADIAVGATHEDVGPVGGQGRVYVFSGADYALLRTLTTPNPEPSLIHGFGTFISMGVIVHAGRADIAVGATFETVDGDAAAGRLYVFGGQTGALLYAVESPNSQASGLFGYAPVGRFLDVSGDGKADIAAGAFGEVAGQGRVYVFSGPNADDLDGDGCSASEEGGANPMLGGMRDPANEWDFYDVNGSRKVDSADIGLVRSRFNSSGPTPPPDWIYDRSAGTNVWAPGPPNNAINAVDIAMVRSAFNHNCQAPP